MKSFRELVLKKLLLTSVLSALKNFLENLLVESFPVNVLELQYAFLRTKGRLSQIISKVDIRKCSLKFNCFETFHKFPRNHPW